MCLYLLDWNLLYAGISDGLLIWNGIHEVSNRIFWLCVLSSPISNSIRLKIFWRIHHCPYLYTLSHQTDLLSVNGIIILSVIYTAINSAPMLTFSITFISSGAISVARKKGSTVHAPLSNITCSMRYA